MPERNHQEVNAQQVQRDFPGEAGDKQEPAEQFNIRSIPGGEPNEPFA
ncbi:MAG: hypothetical protein ABI863_02995 [Ginsengibacter sp.]